MQLKQFKTQFPIQKCSFCQTDLGFTEGSHKGISTGMYTVSCKNTLPCASGFFLLADTDGIVRYWEVDLYIDKLQYNLECSNYTRPKTKLSKWFYQDIDGSYKKSFYLAAPCLTANAFYHPSVDAEFYKSLVKKLKDLIPFT